ncbi:MAG TPA: GFA family protein [Aestuariivirgaceae bacterium]|nr:GFA family protein [Aestuariivirgaceae bacterium]
MTVHSGSCLCGAVAYEVTGQLRNAIGCHCTQCRKMTGHYLAATAVGHDRFRLTREEGLAWYRSSDTAKRGFCRVCGSTLFWQGEGRDYIAIAAGSLDQPTGIRLEGHIFCADKGDYYDIADGDYQRPQGLKG